MKILTSNDDGVNASGNVFLREKLGESFDVLTVAPNQERSSCGHAITLGEPVRVSKLKENLYSCSGYPADCVLVALGNFYKGNKPDLVVSGINIGANLGQDRFYSGTIAAAREASFREVPSIAISLVLNSNDHIQHFEVAANYVHHLVSNDIHKIIPEMSVLNINVPNLSNDKIKGYKLTTTGYQKYSEEIIERTDGRGKTYFWVGGTYEGHKDIPGSDCNAVAEGYISLNLQDLDGKEIIDKNILSNLKEIIQI